METGSRVALRENTLDTKNRMVYAGETGIVIGGVGPDIHILTMDTTGHPVVHAPYRLLREVRQPSRPQRR